MTTTRADWFWKAWATVLLLLLAKLAFASAPATGPRLDLSLVRPLHAQEVAIGSNVICTSAAEGTILYCWTITAAPAGPTVKWYGAFKVPNT